MMFLEIIIYDELFFAKKAQTKTHQTLKKTKILTQNVMKNSSRKQTQNQIKKFPQSLNLKPQTFFLCAFSLLSSVLSKAIAR